MKASLIFLIIWISSGLNLYGLQTDNLVLTVFSLLLGLAGAIWLHSCVRRKEDSF